MGLFGTQPNSDALQDLGEGILVKNSALRCRTASPGGFSDAWLMVHDDSSRSMWRQRASTALLNISLASSVCLSANGNKPLVD